jgi:hypothetical protein
VPDLGLLLPGMDLTVQYSTGHRDIADIKRSDKKKAERMREGITRSHIDTPEGDWLSKYNHQAI